MGTPVIRIGDIQDERIDTSKMVFINRTEYDKDLSRYEVVKGDLLIAMSGATTGKIGFIEDDKVFLLNQRVGKFEPKNDLNKQFLFYYLNTKVEEALAISAGSAQPNLSTKQINDFKIPIPPLPEQKRIVEILDEAFEAIDQAKANIEKNIQNAEELFQSKLNEIFSQKGDGWEEKRLGDVCEYDKTRNERTDLPYVGMEDIESNTGIFLGELNTRTVKSSTFYFSKSHLLYGRLRPYLNKVLAPNFEGHCSTEIFPIKPNESIQRQFLFYWFIKSSTVDKINATCTGARMPRGNMNEVLKFSISIPSIAIQDELVLKLNALKEATNTIIGKYSKSILQLEELKKSILQKAFSGELTANEELVV